MLKSRLASVLDLKAALSTSTATPTAPEVRRGDTGTDPIDEREASRPLFCRVVNVTDKAIQPQLG